ncbi:flagellar biosynthesis GTPase FlhF [Pseudomonas nitritireducens]|uniref:Flagellar biosynthesis GTPase FlhF n=1 Tax=Pseudomonas nitroreducens TaxID=46680 RepID=A0A7W7KTD0_PSENT|nr:flagellar biosynthesis GTPase FlhF [Pseudomonas nitritireducens]
MKSSPNLDQMTPDQLRTLAAQLLSKVDTMGRKIHRDQTIIEQLTHEIAILKRHKFAKRSEQISPAQGSLLDDLLNTDLEAIEAELKALHRAPHRQNHASNPSVQRCRRSSLALLSITNRTTLSAPVAANFSASAKTSARNWITRQACSPLSSTYVGSGSAVSVKH